MALNITDATHALCYHLGNTSSWSEHTSYSHISLSSLPSPDTPVVLESCPIEIRSETSVFRPKNIANLWTQLLSIHIQNGNVWKHGNAIALHKEKSPPPVSARDEAQANAAAKQEREVIFIRHKIQKALLSTNKQPSEEDLTQVSILFSKLESYDDLSVKTLRYSKVHKVCRAVMKAENVPGGDSYQFTARAALLYEKFSNILDQETPNADPPKETEIPAQKELNFKDEELTESPAICLTQLTPEQCGRIEEAAEACRPPLDRGVVELMCLLPQITSKYGTDDLQIIPDSKLMQPLDEFPRLERALWHGGPIIPPHMVQLTKELAPGYCTALFVDTKTGEGFQLKNFGPFDSGVVCTEFEGKRRPIEEMLQEWIDHFLSMKFVPSGGDDIMSDKFRSMDRLKQKYLLQEFGWPTAFPLSPPEYVSLIRRQADLFKERCDRWENNRDLDRQWNSLARDWHKANRTHKDPEHTNKQDIERFKALDGAIERALQYYIRKAEDRQYSLAEDLPLDTRYHSPLTLYSSSHSGDDWRVDITPVMIIERFNEVAGPSDENTDIEKMKEILDRAFERWKTDQQHIYVPDYVDEDDDDPTEDYEVSEEESDEEEEFEVDEEDDDLDFDLVMLEEDAKREIEDIKRDLEGYQIEGV